MGNEQKTLARGKLEDFRVRAVRQPQLAQAMKLDRGLTARQAKHNRFRQVMIGEKSRPTH